LKRTSRCDYLSNASSSAVKSSRVVRGLLSRHMKLPVPFVDKEVIEL